MHPRAIARRQIEQCIPEALFTSRRQSFAAWVFTFMQESYARTEGMSACIHWPTRGSAIHEASLPSPPSHRSPAFHGITGGCADLGNEHPRMVSPNPWARIGTSSFAFLISASHLHLIHCRKTSQLTRFSAYLYDYQLRVQPDGRRMDNSRRRTYS